MARLRHLRMAVSTRARAAFGCLPDAAHPSSALRAVTRILSLSDAGSMARPAVFWASTPPPSPPWARFRVSRHAEVVPEARTRVPSRKERWYAKRMERSRQSSAVPS